MATFPLPFRPTANYHTGGLRYGADRADGRKHAACDLLAPVGTEIYAVESGQITVAKYPFYHGTYAIEFKLDSGLLVRYCEIKDVAEGLSVGSRLREGDLIAYVGKMYKDSMLHFELYSGSGSGGLTVRSNKPFQRRSDLIDPTDYLDKAAVGTMCLAPATE